MKTFEEFRFRVKHNNITSKIPIKDLKEGDWFYTASEYSCNHCQITKIVNKDTRFENCISLYFYDGIEESSWFIYDKYMINNYTCGLLKTKWVVTTDEETAKKYAREFGYTDDIKEFPAK